MKRILYPVVAIIVLLIASCSEDFDTAAPYKNITIVYGMLNIGDTAHYIRIQKAFLDQTKSALVMAKIPDSNFYPVLDVKMKVISAGNIINTITLTKVDLNLEGYPKDTSGQFFNSPNYAYKFKDLLDPNYTYRLVIYNPGTGETDSAESPVISNDINVFRVTAPDFKNTSYAINIEHTIVTIGNTFKVAGASPPNSMMFEGIIRFHYIDIDQASTAETRQFADWTFGTTHSTTVFNMTIPNGQFYSGVRSSLGVAETGHVRRLDSCDIFVWAGSPELYNYQVVTQTQANSLTSDEIQPSYTNIKGKNVLGLFASRAMVKDTTVGFTVPSMDSLMSNPITQPCLIIGPSLY